MGDEQMSDPQEELSTPGTTRSDVRVPVVVSFAAEDRDWADWVRVHLDALGQRHELLEPALPPGPEALRRIAELRRAGTVPLVVVSDALLAGAGRSLDLDRLDTTALPLVLVLIEDVALPPEWVGAARASMFEAADDYDGSRALLLGALETVLGPTGTDDFPAVRSFRSMPAPLVVIDPFPVPTPAPAVAPVEPAPAATTITPATTTTTTTTPTTTPAPAPAGPTLPAALPVGLDPVGARPTMPIGLGAPAAERPAAVEPTPGTLVALAPAPAHLAGPDAITPVALVGPAPAPEPAAPAPLGSIGAAALADALRRHVDRPVGLAPLPGPAQRPAAGLLRLGTGQAVHAAGLGGAAVTETEDEVRPQRPAVARRRTPVLPRPEVEGRPAVFRLPLGATARRWSVDSALGALDRGLRARWGERTVGDGGLFARDSVASPVTDAVVAAVGPVGTGTTTVALAHAHRHLDRVDVLWWVRGITTTTVRADLRSLAVAIGIDATDTAGLLEGLRDWLETTDHPWLIVVDGLQPGVQLDGLLPTAGPGHVVVTGRSVPPGLQFVSVNPPGVGAARRALTGAAGPGDDGPTAAALEQIAAALAPHPWALAIAAGLLGTGAVDAVFLASRLERSEVPAGFVAPTEPADAVALVALEVLGLGSAAVDALLAAAVLAPAPLSFDLIARPADDHVSRGLGAALLTLGDDHVALVPAVAAALRRLATPATLTAARGRALELLDQALPDQAGASVTDLYAPHVLALAETASPGALGEPAGRVARVAEAWRARLADEVAVSAPTTGALRAPDAAAMVRGLLSEPTAPTGTATPDDAVAPVVPVPPHVPTAQPTPLPAAATAVGAVPAPAVAAPVVAPVVPAPVVPASVVPEPVTAAPVAPAPQLIAPTVAEPTPVGPAAAAPVIAARAPHSPKPEPAGPELSGPAAPEHETAPTSTTVAPSPAAGVPQTPAPQTPEQAVAITVDAIPSAHDPISPAPVVAAAGPNVAATGSTAGPDPTPGVVIEHVPVVAAPTVDSPGEPAPTAVLPAGAGEAGHVPDAHDRVPESEPVAAAPAMFDRLRTVAEAEAAAGDHDAAVEHLDQRAALADAAFGPADLRTLGARTDAALALAAAGRRNRSNQALTRILADAERFYGPDHAASIVAKQTLANSHAELGRDEVALILRTEVLEARERTQGSDHPQTLVARSNLASSLAAAGRAEEALAMRMTVVEIRERTLGTDHPQTTGARNNLANSYADTGRHELALLLRQQVFDVRERTLGAAHPQTITARNNLANSLAAVGRADEARAQRERTLADSERVLGPDHPHTVTARANLAFAGAESAAPAAPGTAATATPTDDGAGQLIVGIPAAIMGAPPAIEPALFDPPAAGPGAGTAPGPGMREPTAGGRAKRFWFFRRR